VSTLITGLSTRAIAESAVRGGHDVTTLDFFGDRDQRLLVSNYALRRDFGLPFSAAGLLQASRYLEYDRVVYISNLENYPEVVEKLAQGRVLLGNSPDVLHRVRDWQVLRDYCRRMFIACPITLLAGEEDEAEPSTSWLRKPIRSGGGHGIQPWGGEPLDHDHILQTHVEGRCASAAFVANRHESVVLGLTEQLIGRDELGARQFAWCGNILPLEPCGVEQFTLLKEVERMANCLTREFGLRGVNGMDMVIVDGDNSGPRAYLLEVNPRYTASMELIERAYGLNIFSLHVEAMAGWLPNFSLADHIHGPYFGKGIVYARETVAIPETERWLEKDRRDIPFPGEQIEAGQPICTVLVQATTRESCWERLLSAEDTVREEIGDGGRVWQ
jgi:predicted ATP-grasp superfamily ATP-dependent carboligase